MQGGHSFGNVSVVVSNVCENSRSLCVAAGLTPACDTDYLLNSLDGRKKWSTGVAVAGTCVNALTLYVSASGNHGVLVEVLRGKF